MSSLSRRQIIVWSLTGFVILAIGAGYLRGHLTDDGHHTATAITIAAVTDSAAASMKIHVVGAVTRPGLYEAGPGSRVADAVALAGGSTPDADLSKINLAAKLADGQQVAVPQKNSAAGGTAPGTGGGGAGPAGDAAAASPGNPVNLNSANAAQLDSLDGIGPKTAQKIIDYREAHGGFRSIEELLEVPGIGQAKLDQIKGELTL
ncbi:MAG: helix-hairpin-helix domain-containing protein [Thermoleophilia bacterium]